MWVIELWLHLAVKVDIGIRLESAVADISAASPVPRLRDKPGRINDEKLSTPLQHCRKPKRRTLRVR
jgi:hypothetical protein